MIDLSVHVLKDGKPPQSAPRGPRGGAVYNAGTLTLENTVLSENSVYDNITYTGTAAGGAIYNVGNLTLRNVSLTNNNAYSANCPEGGAVVNESTGILDASDTTFSYNSSNGMSGGLGQPCAIGGALYNTGAATIQRSIFYANTSLRIGGIYTSGTLSLTNSTLNLNTMTQYGPLGGSAMSVDGTATLSHVTISQNNGSETIPGDTRPGLYIINGATLNLRNSIIAGNTYKSTIPCDVVGTITSQGYNLVQTRTGSSGYIASDLPDGTNPLLNAIADNGGPTLTASLANGSPAIDAIPTTGGCNDAGVTTDQRGAARPAGVGCDVGAYEAGGILPPTSTPTATPTHTVTPIPPHPDTIGVYKNGSWYLRNTNTSGGYDQYAVFGGESSDLPVAGDWNGDSVDSLGVYRGNVGQFILSNSNSGILTESYRLTFRNPGDTPFAGRWTSDMSHDGLGVYRNSNGILYQKKDIATGFSDYFAIYGSPGDQGVAGDWDANGFDSIAIYRADDQKWYLSNNSTPSGITYGDSNFTFSIGGGLPVTGDWNGDSISTVGYLTATGNFVLHPNNANIGTDNVFAFGPTGGKPVAGKWAASGVAHPVSIVGQQNGSVNSGVENAVD